MDDMGFGQAPFCASSECLFTLMNNYTLSRSCQDYQLTGGVTRFVAADLE
jgi:hypothetical protein